MVNTVKFSQFVSGGNIAINNSVAGLQSNTNALFNIPWAFLPPGSTASRPAPSSSTNYMLRFNTDLLLYEYYDAATAQWVQLENGSLTPGPFVIYEADTSLPSAFNLGNLSSGLLKQSVTSNVATPAIAQLDTDYYGPGMTGYMQAPAGIKDANGNIVLNFESNLGAVNYITVANVPTGDSVPILAAGSDTDIALVLAAKGTDPVYINSENTLSPFRIFSGTGLQHLTAFYIANTAASRSVTWQDSDGTVAWLTDIPAVSPSALTKIDDTNVTLTLGGTPATALLQATSITAGWTGTLSGTRGGTGINNGAHTATFAGNLNFANSFTTSGNFAVTQTYTGVTNVTFPTAGTLATTSQLVTPAALTKTDDTNVTLTLGGSPSTALVNAASLTLGWTGQLAVSRGGTGISSFGTGVATALGQNVNGSGAISLTTSPTFVTPVLGAATATSINFGGSALSVYAENQSWTPVVTFATPGDLSVAYTTQGGVYTDIGRVRILAFSLVFTPTYTTASGAFEITGIGITGNGNYTAPLVIASAFTWTAGRTQLILECPATNYLVINQFGTGVGAALITTTNFTSGVAVTISGSITVLH